MSSTMVLVQIVEHYYAGVLCHVTVMPSAMVSVNLQTTALTSVETSKFVSV